MSICALGYNVEDCPICEITRLREERLSDIRKVRADEQEKRLRLETTIAALREGLEAWKVRLAYSGHPKEAKQTDGTPDWSGVVSLTDALLTSPDPGAPLRRVVEAADELERFMGRNANTTSVWQAFCAALAAWREGRT